MTDRDEGTVKADLKSVRSLSRQISHTPNAIKSGCAFITTLPDRTTATKTDDRTRAYHSLLRWNSIRCLREPATDRHQCGNPSNRCPRPGTLLLPAAVACTALVPAARRYCCPMFREKNERKDFSERAPFIYRDCYYFTPGGTWICHACITIPQAGLSVSGVADEEPATHISGKYFFLLFALNWLDLGHFILSWSKMKYLKVHKGTP